MQRICGTLARAGYAVTLVGRVLPDSPSLKKETFAQYRLRCRWNKGFPFYAEYNLRLFWWLMKTEMDAVCSIDYDTLGAGCLAALLRRKKRIFDAHEYFTQVPEVVHRPFVRFFWEMIARVCLPFYRQAYTVGPQLAAIFEKRYNVPFSVIRNVPASIALSNEIKTDKATPRILLYQGALNEGRGIEALLAAMQQLDNVVLWLAGEGDLSQSLRQLAETLGVSHKVHFWGYTPPAQLKKLTREAYIGLNLLENRGLSYYYSLANKFFDCVQAQVPVITMNFPEYRALNAEYEVAVLLDDLAVPRIVEAIEQLCQNPETYTRLQNNCAKAAQIWNWEREEQQLLSIYQKL
jgi:glycosyltransferase involved in cell wall biosynthesis